MITGAFQSHASIRLQFINRHAENHASFVEAKLGLAAHIARHGSRPPPWDGAFSDSAALRDSWQRLRGRMSNVETASIAASGPGPTRYNPQERTSSIVKLNSSRN